VQLEVLMARASDPRKVVEWQRRMARFEDSPLSVARFCQREGVSVPAFYHWRKKLQRPRQTPAPPPPAPKQTTPVFTPLRLVASSSVTVRLPGGTQLELPTADPQVLQLALAALAQADAQHRAGDEPC
jgi:hypothetical protein